MQVKSNITGVTSVSDIQIQKAVSDIIIVKSGTQFPFRDEKIAISVQTGGVNHKVMATQKIMDIAILSQFGNGYQLQ